MRKLVVAFVMLLASTSAYADNRIVIADDMGGFVNKYHDKAAEWMIDGKKIAIKGECASACNIFLMKEYNLDACAMPGSVLEFHVPYFKKAKADGTWEMTIDVEWAEKNERDWRKEWLGHFNDKTNFILAKATKLGLIPSPNRTGDTGKMFIIKATSVLPRC
jgi:hypothetical protein